MNVQSKTFEDLTTAKYDSVELSLPLPRERFSATELRTLLEMVGLKQTEFADICGVNHRTARRWVSEKLEISWTADRLAKLIALEALSSSPVQILRNLRLISHQHGPVDDGE